MSTKDRNRREGDRSEYFAQVLLSGVGLATPVPRQEDVGIDFVCSLSDQRSGVLTFGHPYLVSVKSRSKPKIELFPTKAAIKKKSQRHLLWLFRQELPIFLGVVDKAKFRLSIFSLIPVWFIYYRGGPECGSLVVNPRFKSSDTSHVGAPKVTGPTPGWPSMKHYEVDVGHPIAILDLDVLKDPDAVAQVKVNIRLAANLARKTQVHYHLGIPYFQWIAVTQPDGQAFQGGYAHFDIPPDPAHRGEIMKELLPSLISFARYYKSIGDVESLAAIKRLLRDVPTGSFEPAIRADLPEIFGR